MIAGTVPVEFLLFGLTLLGVALFHARTLEVALAGLADAGQAGYDRLRVALDAPLDARGYF